MNRVIAALLAGALILTGCLGVAAVSERLSHHPFDRMLAIAQMADREYKAALKVDQPWTVVEPKSLDQLKYLVYSVVAKEWELDITPGIMPRDVFFGEFNPALRSGVAGVTYTAVGIVQLNARYLADPSWSGSWFETLIHELTHVQGYLNEAQTETLAIDVLGSFANNNYPSALSLFWKMVRDDALRMAWYFATWEHTGFIHTTQQALPSALFSNCSPCTIPAGDADLLAKLDSVRAGVQTPAEFRYFDARTRFWRHSGSSYRAILEAYTVPVLTVLLDNACGAASIEENTFDRFDDYISPGGIVFGWGKVLEDFSDSTYLLKQAGACS